MATQNQCTQLREKLYELLVEPETAPRRFRKEWISHCSSCLDCVDFFIQQSQEQNSVHSLILQWSSDRKESLLRTSVLSSNSPRKQNLRGKKSPVFYCSIAALLGLLSVVGWKGEYHFLQSKKQESKLSQKNVSPEHVKPVSISSETTFGMVWDSLFQTIQKKQNTEQAALLCSTTPHQWEQEGKQMMEILWEKQIFEKITSDQLPFFAEHLFWHLQRTRQEFRTIAELIHQYEKEQRKSIPFLSRRVNLYCRLALMNSKIQALPDLEKQGYPPSKIQQIFERPIQELTQDIGYENEWVLFFQQSSRSLQNIWTYRNLFLHEIGGESIEKLGGELEILTLVDHLESLISPF